MIRRIIIAIAAMAMCASAQAGTGKAIVAGAVAGLVISSVSSSDAKKPSMVIFTSPHDTIVCSTMDGIKCYYYGNNPLTPAQFAGKSGYKFIHKVSAAIQDGSQYVIMEVSK